MSIPVPPELQALIERGFDLFVSLQGTPIMAGALFLAGALLATLHARLALAAVILFVLWESVGRAELGASFDAPVQLGIAVLAGLGVLQAVLNLLFGRETGGMVLWSTIAFVAVVALWRGPGFLLGLLRLGKAR